MALSTQKGRSFYAFKLQISIYGVLRGHVDKSNIQGKERNLEGGEREREWLIVLSSAGRPDFKGFMEKKFSNFDMTALLMQR
jgi:hypothetical protein